MMGRSWKRAGGRPPFSSFCFLFILPLRLVVSYTFLITFLLFFSLSLRPQSLEELRKIPGLTAMQLSVFGHSLVGLILAFCEKHTHLRQPSRPFSMPLPPSSSAPRALVTAPPPPSPLASSHAPVLLRQPSKQPELKFTQLPLPPSHPPLRPATAAASLPPPPLPTAGAPSPSTPAQPQLSTMGTEVLRLFNQVRMEE